MTSTWFADLARYILLAAGVVFALTLVFVVVMRATRGFRQRAKDARIARLRGDLTRIVDHDFPTTLTRRDHHELMWMVASLAQNVRGEDRSNLAQWMRECGGVDHALKLMRSRLPSNRGRGITLYTPVADADPAPLVSLLDDKNRAVRALAARALGRAAVVSTLPSLLKHMGSGSRSVPRAVAMMAITRMAPRSANPFFQVLPKADHTTAALLVSLVGQLNLVDGRARLEHLLSDPRPQVRLAALKALGELGMPSSIAALEGFRASSDRENAARERALLMIEGG